MTLSLTINKTASMKMEWNVKLNLIAKSWALVVLFKNTY